MSQVPGLRNTAPQDPIIITTDYMARHKALAAEGAVWDRARKAYVVDNPSPKSAAVLCQLFPELRDVYPELTVLRDTLLQDARPFDNATAHDQPIPAINIRKLLAAEKCVRCASLPDGPDPRCPVCDGTQAGSFYPFQEIDLGYIAAVLREHGSAEIAWERGLGKTLAACTLIDDMAADRVLIVAPNTSKQVVWEDELRRFCPDLPIHVMPNGQPEKREKLAQHIATTHNPLVVIAHYESLKLIADSRANRKGWKRLGTWDLTVCDESHRLSNTKTLQHRSLMTIPTDTKLSETGSMIQNHPEEFFGRLRWLFPKLYSSKWRDWNNRYLEYIDSGYGQVLIGPNFDRLEAMREELGVFTVYRRKRDELDLPPTQEHVEYVDLSPQQRAAYNELRDTFVATLDSGEQIIALQPIVQLTRLRQLATGLELVSGQITDSSKLDRAVEIVRGNPADHFVVFSWYKSAAAAMAERLATEGIGAQVVTGDTTHKQRRDRIRAFQSGDGGRVFIGTISTLGESVNLHRANQGIFIDQSWNPAQNDQAADRYSRIGQSKPVTTTKIVARDTVDEYDVMPSLQNKIQIRRMMIGG